MRSNSSSPLTSLSSEAGGNTYGLGRLNIRSPSSPLSTPPAHQHQGDVEMTGGLPIVQEDEDEEEHEEVEYLPARLLQTSSASTSIKHSAPKPPLPWQRGPSPSPTPPTPLPSLTARNLSLSPTQLNTQPASVNRRRGSTPSTGPFSQSPALSSSESTALSSSVSAASSTRPASVDKRRSLTSSTGSDTSSAPVDNTGEPWDDGWDDDDWVEQILVDAAEVWGKDKGKGKQRYTDTPPAGMPAYGRAPVLGEWEDLPANLTMPPRMGESSAMGSRTAALAIDGNAEYQPSEAPDTPPREPSPVPRQRTPINARALIPSPTPPVQPVWRVLDEPWMAGFQRLVDMPDGVQAYIDALVPAEVDVDRWELSISPQEYLNRFGTTLADVQLCNRAPKRKLIAAKNRGPRFDKWLLLASATHQLWVALEFKEEFFRSITAYQTIQQGRLLLQASIGQSHIPTAVFIACLDTAGCTCIRLKSYGQKLPIGNEFVAEEPADLDHDWAEYNYWDIGRSFGSDYIWLFRCINGVHKGVTHWPVMAPGSRDYGTMGFKIRRKHGRHFDIKIYPRLVHVIKSFNSHFQGGVPQTMSGMRKGVEATKSMLLHLGGVPASKLGGFRIEVTVKAPSLATAHRLVMATPYLNPNYWLGIGNAAHHDHVIDARLITKAEMLQNANWVHSRAEDKKIFRGAGGAKPTKEQIKAWADMYSALGFNAGYRTATKSLEPMAWWCSGPRSAPTLYGRLCERYPDGQSIKAFFYHIKGKCLRGALPCKKVRNDHSHRYQTNCQEPYRIRCGKKGCNSRLREQEILRFVAVLVADGEVAEEDLGLDEMLDESVAGEDVIMDDGDNEGEAEDDLHEE